MDAGFVFGALTTDRAPMLWLRAIDSLDTRALEGTEGARYAFWSPDSRFIAFMTQGQLKVIAVGGGSAHVLMDLDNGAGGSWSQDGTIVLSLAFGGLFRTSADGAPLTPLALDNEIGKRARFPVFFPDGRHFMFWVRDGGGAMYLGCA